MKKKIFICSLLFLLGCENQKSAPLLQVFSEYKIPIVSDTIPIFVCSDSANKKSFGKLDFEIIKNTANIKCTYNKGYGGEVVNVILDDKLKVLNITYNYIDDTVGGNAEIYTILKSKIILNKNPFTDKSSGFHGEISIDGEVEIRPLSIFELSTKEKFNFLGYFVCK